MATITNEVRNTLLNDLLQRAFQEEFIALCAEGSSLAESILMNRLTQQEWALANSLPESWLSKTEQVTIYLGTDFHVINLNGYMSMRNLGIKVGYYNFPLNPPETESRAVPKCVMVPTQYKVLDPMGLKIQAWITKHEDLEQRMISMLLKLRGTLESFRSSQKLISAWPEIEPLLTPLLPEKVQLPAIDTKSLNKALDFPV